MALRAAYGRALASWDAGDGELELGPGTRATFVVAESAPTRDHAERRLERTAVTWMDWAGRAEYVGRWREPVLRSALTLKLLTYAPTGAIVAAPTTYCPNGSAATATGTTASWRSAGAAAPRRATK